MFRHFALSHHKHSGLILPHEHTSYLSLGILLAIAGLILIAGTAIAQQHPGPEAGSIGITGVVPGKPPASAPTITSPRPDQRFTTSPVTISGACAAGTLIEVFKNDIFAGSTFCGSDGTYSFDVDLLFGSNVLVARAYDALNQASPSSSAITVTYDAQFAAASPVAGLDFGGAQLILNTDAVFRGVFPEKEMVMPVTVIGGRAPYAINVQWGDSDTKLIPRNDNATFNAVHAYAKPGTYQISLQATDADGRVAFITVAAIVNGQPDPVVSGSSEATSQPNFLLALWPLYVATVGIVVAFWLGERYEKHLLARHHQLIS